VLGFQPQQATIMIVLNAPVEERIGGWNTLKSDIQKLSMLGKNNEVIYYELQFCLVGVWLPVAYFATAPSQLF
jgi:hypothetical protein